MQSGCADSNRSRDPVHRPTLGPTTAEPPPIDIPQAEPPPIDPLPCPPGCLLEHLTNGGTHTPISTDLIKINRDHPETETTPPALAPDCVTHVMCTPWVCGLHAGDKSSITICRVNTSNDHMVDGGLNVCVMGDLSSLVDVVDIDTIPISVALEGSSSSYNDCLTKCGFLPLSFPTVPVIFRCVTIAPTWWKPSYHPRRSYLPAMSSFLGCRKDFGTLQSLAVFASPAKTAFGRCSSHYIAVTAYITVRLTYTLWTVTPFNLRAHVQQTTTSPHPGIAQPPNLSPPRAPDK